MRAGPMLWRSTNAWLQGVRPSVQRTPEPSARYFSSSAVHLFQTILLLSGIPETTTHNDIANLCFSTTYEERETHSGEGQQDSSESNSKSSSSILLQNMIDVRLLRSATLGSTGRALITFDHLDHANEFHKRAMGKMLGGRKIKVHTITQGASRRLERYGAKYDEFGKRSGLPSSIETLKELQRRAPGRVVMLKGLPLSIDEARLERILRNTYTLEESTPDLNDVDGDRYRAVVHVSHETSLHSFLVTLKSVSDAMRLVRRWHNVPYDRRWQRSRRRSDPYDFSDAEEVVVEEEVEEDDENDDYESYAQSVMDSDRFFASGDSHDNRSGDRAKELGLHTTPHVCQAYIMY